MIVRSRFVVGCAVMAASAFLWGCLGESPNPVVFDQVIESTIFSNQLLSPVVVYRNGRVLDTLPSRTTRTYQIGQKGIFQHGWKLVSPRSPFGEPYGIEPFVDLGIQYNVNDVVIITNTANGRTLFTPRIVNAWFGPITLITVNGWASDRRDPGLTLFAGESTSLDHAPYYYWNATSDVVIGDVNGFHIWRASRVDTNEQGEPQLRLEEPGGYIGSGLTNTLVIF